MLSLLPSFSHKEKKYSALKMFQAGGMAQQLRVLAAFSDDPDSIPSIAA